MDQLNKDSDFINSIKTYDEIELNDTSEYYIHSDTWMKPDSIVFIKTKTMNDTLIYILTIDSSIISSNSHLTDFKDIHQLYKYSVQYSNNLKHQAVSLIGNNKRDKFSLITYKITTEGIIIVDNEKIGFNEIMPALPYTNLKDSIYSITRDSVTISYEERLGVDKNTVSYIASVNWPSGCINSFASAGIETETNQIDILRFSKPLPGTKFIIHIEEERRRVWLENFYSGCDSLKVINLMEE